MNRADFQRLAELRLIEGKALLDVGHYAGAYYLLGYAVECALKACIAKRTNLYDFPPKRNVVDEIYSHDLSKLVGQAGLRRDFLEARRVNRALEENWTVVKDWSEESRYDPVISASSASGLYEAIAEPEYGVLAWLMRWW